MAAICDICGINESKYKCPTCGLKYCSLVCYKPHKVQHENDPVTQNVSTGTTSRIDRPGTTQRTTKQAFTDFENDPEFQRLLKRYPRLRTQLQGIYALTLDPGPEEQRTWSRGQLPMVERSFAARGSRGRGQRGRGGASRGGRNALNEPPEGRQGGRWTREKGDTEALFVMRKVQDESTHEDLADGLDEFVELVKMRFGNRETG